MHMNVLSRAGAVCTLLVLFAAHIATAAPVEAKSPPPLKVETLATGLNLPWSMAFAPDGSILIIEKAGGLRVYRDGALLPATLTESRIGFPDDVMVKEDSGLHDIALDPDFATTRTVFIAYAGGTEEANHTSVWRARLRTTAWWTDALFFAPGRTRLNPNTLADASCSCRIRPSS